MMQKLRQIDRRLLTILLIVFVQMLGASMALPILPLFAQREFALDERLIPLIISVFFAAQFVAGPTIGRLSDRYGRVPVLVVSQIGTAIAFALLASAQSVWMLFFARILDGITGGNIIAAQAYVTDITPKEKRAESLGYIFAAFGLGFIFGPAVGGVLSAWFGSRAPLWLACVAATVVVFITWFTLDETVSAEKRAESKQNGGQKLSLPEVFGNVPLLYVLGIALVTQFAFGMLQSTFALWGEAVVFADYDQRTTDMGIGVLLSVVGITQFLAQTFLIRRMLERFTEETMIILGSFLRVIGFFLFAIAASPWPVPFGGVFFALGAAITLPPLQSVATKTVADEVRGEVLGYFTAVSSLAIIFSTASAGLLFGISPTLQLWTGLVLMLIATIPAFMLRRWAQRHPAAEVEAGDSRLPGRMP